MGAVQNVSGRMGKSFSFDGADDKLTIPNSNSLVLGNNDFAISFWIVSPYTSNVPWAGIIRKGGTTSAPVNTWVFYKSSASNTSLRFNAINDTAGQFSIQLTGSTINGWNNVLVTRAGNTSTMYINGLLVDTDTTSNANLSSTDSIVFANGANGVDFLSTSIDDVLIFNRSLSVAEIYALYANTTSKYYSNNFTNLSSANHNFKAYAQDIAGNVNFTDLRTVTVQTVGPPSNKSFIITNLSGGTVAMFDDKGDAYFKGTVTQNVGDGMNPTSNSFIIQNNQGLARAYINSTGSLFLSETIVIGSDLTGLTSGNLEFRNSTGSLVSFFDNTGNLKLKGGYAENYDFEEPPGDSIINKFINLPRLHIYVTLVI